MKKDFSMKITRDSEFTEKVLNLSRVSKKTSGGSTLGFTALLVVGNKNGKVGIGYGKARNQGTAVAKARSSAYKNIVNVALKGTTIGHEVSAKYGASKVLLKPAPEGTGVIAGGAVRSIAELAGIKNLSAKMLGSSNKITGCICTLNALGKLKASL